MLRLPRQDEKTPPLVATDDAPSEIATNPDEPVVPTASKTPASLPSLVPLMLGMAVPGLLLLVAAWYWLKPDVTKSVRPPAPDPTVVVSLRKPDAEAPAPSPAKKTMPDGVELLREVEAVVKAYMEAPTMEEALRFVHEPARAGERWKKWLKGEPYQAPGFRRVAEESLAVANDTLASIRALNADFEQQALALHFAEGRFLVDWESSVGWSEMTLDEFRREKPAEAKVFRVILSNVSYYNFGFSDELEWTSFRLDSPDGEQSIYGYVKRASELDAKIRPSEERARMPVMLRLRFPEGAPSDNQVLIEEQIGMGWVETASNP